MKVTKQKCLDIIECNTTGRNKNNPNFTALANAKKWLRNMESWKNQGFLEVDWSLPEHDRFLNE